MSLNPKSQPSPLPKEGSNPFSTCFVSPGTISYVFPPGDGADGLIDRLRDGSWWGQIVGPHGTGKTTLLRALAGPLQMAGRTLCRVTLHRGDRRGPISAENVRSFRPETQVVVDGYEQLNFWQRFRLARLCRRHKTGLLITTHRDAGLPDLPFTPCDLPAAERIVQHLLRDAPPLIADADVARLFERHRGDLRETLFGLYDLFEERRA